MTQIEQIPGLQIQLDAKRNASTLPDEKKQVIKNTIAWLESTDIIETSLQVGQKAPDFSLPEVNGQMVTLYGLLRKGPVVLAFYRGGWCPYCNLQLRAYQAILPEIDAAGGQLIAISPQTPDNSLSTTEKAELSFSVLSDVGNRVAREYGLVFRLPDDLREVYLGIGNDLERFNGSTDWELPVPGTYVIDTSGIVRYAFANADYTQRAEPVDLLKALRDII